MKALAIIGTAHKGNTRALVDLFLDEFKDVGMEVEEAVLQDEFNEFCLGCANCILRGEDSCPHFSKINPLVEKMEKSDLIILASPVFVASCSSGMKAFLDHLAYMWLVHRPKASMFRKAGLVLTTAAGSGIKPTSKLLKTNLFYWGVPKAFDFSITAMKMGGNYSECSKKDKIIRQGKKKARRVERYLSKRSVGLKTRFFFKLFGMTQKNGWNKTDSDYWKSQGWLDGKKPY